MPEISSALFLITVFLLFAIGSAGAYGAVQAGTYNTRPLVPEVLVKDDDFHVVRPRIEVEDLIAMDSVPDWF